MQISFGVKSLFSPWSWRDHRYQDTTLDKIISINILCLKRQTFTLCHAIWGQMSIDIDQRLGLKSQWTFRIGLGVLIHLRARCLLPSATVVAETLCFTGVCLSTEGRCTPPGRQTSPWADTPWQADTPLADNPLADKHPPSRDGYCSGRYASYWNAFLLKFMPSIYDCCRPWRNSVSRERSQPASRRRWRRDMYPALGTVSSAEVSAALSRMTREILFTSPWITWPFYSTNMANKRCQKRSIW